MKWFAVMVVGILVCGFNDIYFRDMDHASGGVNTGSWDFVGTVLIIIGVVGMIFDSSQEAEEECECYEIEEEEDERPSVPRVSD